MNKVIFTISEDQLPQFLKISKNTDLGITCQINRIINGYKITVDALGGREGNIEEFIKLLKSLDFSI